MSDRSTPTHWVDGRLHDDEPQTRAPWQWIALVAVLVWLFDLALGLRSPSLEPVDADGPSLRGRLRAAEREAAAGRRSILLIGDSVLAGDVLAGERPDDWASQRVVDHMRRALARDADVGIEQIALDGLLPVDALHLLSELDRVDPRAEVEVVFELNLRYFSAQYAEQRECTRAALCELGDDGEPERRLPVIAWEGLAEAATRVHDRLLAATPVHRRRDRVDVEALDRVAGLAVARDQADADPERAPDDAEARARVREHYRSARPGHSRHAQVEALTALLDRAHARGRKLTLFWTPLEDRFARRAVGEDRLGARYVEIAARVNDYADPRLALLDLDHPLFVDALFLDHVHLGVDGSRLLALNLLHELNLPLAQRPFEREMIHPEGHDRSLVHRVDVGYAEGGAWQALFRGPFGVAVSRDGGRVVVADTYNHVLRELRGNMQWVETVAGRPEQAGRLDGPAREAELDHPRGVELLDEAAWFIDGERRDALRVLDGGYVRTPSFAGERCDRYRSIRARPGGDDRPPAVWALCEDSRLLHIDLARDVATQVAENFTMSELVAFDLAGDAVYLADADGRLWRRELGHVDGSPRLGGWTNLFANTGTELLPSGYRVGYPYGYDELRLAKVVDLRFVERYGGLLVADELPLGRGSKRLEREWTERVMLRYFDLDAERILPWIKAVPHGEAHALTNELTEQVASYWHLGAMALAQDDASLVWIERRRSRVIRVADGLLGVAKTGNHHTRGISVPMLQTLAGVSRAVESQLRPDRYMTLRHEPLARRGPYVALLLGSSLSSMSDRLSNYSLGRRLELELQRELGYRDLTRLDLFQLSWPAAAFGDNVNNLANWMASSVPPDVIFIEAHDFGGAKHYLRETKTRAELIDAFARLRELADRYDSMVVFYDLSSLEANRRDGMRSTDSGVKALLREAEQLGFVVLEPGDALFRELLRHSPWGSQPFGENQHHGAPWAIDRTAEALALMVYPKLREFLRERVPARERERPPTEFEVARREPLGPALAAAGYDREALAIVDPRYVQTEFIDGELRVFVDLAGFAGASRADLDALAVAVVDAALREDVYAEFAERLRVELVEFANYDEYGNGVVESARSQWRREFDRAGLEAFLREHGPR